MTTKIKSYQELPATFGQIEEAIWKNSDELAIAIARSFERLEEHVDAAETRIYGVLRDIEDRLPVKKD